jgi:hypothetical protein
MHFNSSVRNTSTAMLFGTADNLLVKHSMIRATGMRATIRAGQDEGRSESIMIKIVYNLVGYVALRHLHTIHSHPHQLRGPETSFPLLTHWSPTACPKSPKASARSRSSSSCVYVRKVSHILAGREPMLRTAETSPQFRLYGYLDTYLFILNWCHLRFVSIYYKA